MLALFLLIPVVSWMLAGIVAERRARRLQLPERAGAAAPFKGAIWAGRVLIWSTKSPDDVITHQNDSLVDEFTDPEDELSFLEPDLLEESSVGTEALSHEADMIEDTEFVHEAPVEEHKEFAPSFDEEPVTATPLVEESTLSEEPIFEGSAPSEEPIFVDEPVMVEEPIFAEEPPPAPVYDSVLATHAPESAFVELNQDVELEPFDALPKRPRFGKVKTVCPHCRARTKHDREGTCATCHQPNAWLRQRWQIAVPGEEIDLGTTDVYTDQLQQLDDQEHDREESFIDVVREEPLHETPQDVAIPDHAVASLNGQCPTCHHSLYIDYYNRCVFCNTPIEVNS